MATDLATYWLLLHIFGPHFTSGAKACSFLSASCVAYLMNKFWTFKATKHCWSEISRFLCLYGGSLVANVTVNKIVILALPFILPEPLQQFTYPTAWFMATGASTMLNYFGQKYWVFRPLPPAHNS